MPVALAVVPGFMTASCIMYTAAQPVPEPPSGISVFVVQSFVAESAFPSAAVSVPAVSPPIRSMPPESAPLSVHFLASEEQAKVERERMATRAKAVEVFTRRHSRGAALSGEDPTAHPLLISGRRVEPAPG